MNEILITPDMCMRFLIWSYYYHNIMPQKNTSYAECKKFNEADITKLDEIKDALFKCYDEQSIERACMQFQRAKVTGEPCPFSQSDLDRIFATPII